MQTKNKLNEMYWMGYCDATIQHASTTDQGRAGADKRMAWVQRHFNDCEQCKLANIVRALEYETAATLGPDAIMLFQNGGDVRAFDGFRNALSQTLERAIKQGIVTPFIYDWMCQTAKRYGNDWPGLAFVKVAPEN